jgi:WD40 repeat protein
MKRHRTLTVLILLSATFATTTAQSGNDPPPPHADAALPSGAIFRLGESRLRHAGTVNCLTFSPDGKLLISGGEDGFIRVWDAASGECLRFLRIRESTVLALHYTSDGQKLAANCSDGQLWFLDPNSLKQLLLTPAGSGPVFAASPNGSLVAVNTVEERSEVHEVDTGLSCVELPSFAEASFLSDGKRIVIADAGGKIAVHLVKGGKPLTVFHQAAPIDGLAVSPDQKRIAAGSGGPGAEIKIWEIGHAEPVQAIPDAHQARSWIGTDRLAARKGNDVGVYDLRTRKWVGLVKEVRGVWAISPDGSKAATVAPGSSKIHLWDVADGKQLYADNGTLSELAVIIPTKDGKSLFGIGGDAALSWHLADRRSRAVGKLPGKALRAAAGGGRLAVSTSEGLLVYDDFDPTRPLAAKPARTLGDAAINCRTVAVSPDGKMVAYSARETGIILADAATGTRQHFYTAPSSGLAAAFTLDNSRLAVLGRDGFLRLSRTSSGMKERELWKVRVQRGPKGAVAVSPDGKLVAASSSRVLTVVSASDGSTVFTVDRREFDDGPFQQIAFTPDSRYVITGSGGTNGAVQVWDVKTHRLVRRFATGMGAILHLGVFPGSDRVASAGAEEAITVWDLSHTGTADRP